MKLKLILTGLIKRVTSIFYTNKVEDLSLYASNRVKYTICPTGEVVNGMCENCTCRPTRSSSKN